MSATKEIGALAAYRLKIGRTYLYFLWANFAALGVIALEVQGSWALLYVILSALICAACTFTLARDPTGPTTRILCCLGGSALAALLISVAQSTRFVLDMHMYSFAVLAISAAWCCWRGLIVAGAFVVIHYLTLGVLYPAAVFPDQTLNIVRVMIHAAMVVVEVGALCVLVRFFIIAVEKTEQALEEVASANLRALDLVEKQMNLVNLRASEHDRVLADVASFRDRSEVELMSIRNAGQTMRARGQELKTAASRSEAAASDVKTASSHTALGLETVSSATIDGRHGIGHPWNHRRSFRKHWRRNDRSCGRKWRCLDARTSEVPYGEQETQN